MKQNDLSAAAAEQDALNKIPSGVGIYDVTGSHIEMKYLNDGYYQMLGTDRLARTQYFGPNVINAIYPDDRSALLREAHDSVRERRLFDLHFRVLNGAGVYSWIGIRANHEALDGGTERFYAAYYDADQLISERQKLEAHGIQLDKILGNIPGGVAVFSEKDREIRLVYTNSGFYALHHGSSEYWSGQSKNPTDWLAPEDRHLFWDEFERVISGAEDQGNVAYRILGEDGELHWVGNSFCRAYQIDGMQYYYASFTDLDEQIAAEQELRQAKLMYDDAARSAKLIIWSYDIETRRTKLMQSGYTEEICRTLNIPPVIENTDEFLAGFVHPDDRAAFQGAYRSIEEGAKSAECEFRFQLPGQDSLQLERMKLRRVTDKEGRLLTVYCFGQNITEQRENEERLNHAYEKLLNPNSYGSFHLNLTKNHCGNGIAGKSQMKSVLDLENSGTVDGYFSDFSKLIADDDVRNEFFRRFDRRLLLSQFGHGMDDISIEYPVVYENGVRHWREGFLSMVKNPNTGDVEAVTYSYDIDARKRDEFIMNRLIHDHFDYIGIIHPSGKTFEFRSRKPWITFGEIGEQLEYAECSRYVRSQFAREDERRAFDETADLDTIVRDMNENGTRTAAYIKTVDGKATCTRLRYSWLEKAGGDILVLRSDITESYQKEQRQIELLEKEKRAAEAANIAKSEFLSRMSHDMRTPLNGIIGMTYLTQKQVLPEKARENLKKIETSSKFLLSLINDILDMSKAESGKIELHPEPYPVYEFRDYINSIILPLCAERSQTFLFEPAEILPDAIPLFDKLRINQVVFNLLSNAVKYTPEGGTIHYRVAEKKLGSRRMSMHLDIIDNGIGMSEEFQRVLFNPFTQENRRESSKMYGSGLGLAITKRLIDAMGGTISVKSRPGEGTTFLLDFLLDCIPAADVDKTSEAKGAPAESLEGRHVLLCEDHPLNQEIAKAILEGKQARVTIADNGEAGVKMFLGSSIGYFDCIMMDIHMPVMDGYEATRSIRALNRSDAKTVPIIAMTADAFADDVQRCLDAGMNGHIAKPFEPQKLYLLLKDFILRDEEGAEK